jgi:hypothetical protein
LVDSISNQIVPPRLDLTGQIELLGMGAEIVDGRLLVDARLVSADLLEYGSDLRVVFESVPIEEIEDRGRIERSALVRVVDSL